MTSTAHHTSELPSAGEIFDELAVMATMPVVGLSVCPGFFLCVPVIVLVIVPVVALAVLVLAAGLLAAAATVPLLLARLLGRAAVHRAQRLSLPHLPHARPARTPALR